MSRRVGGIFNGTGAAVYIGIGFIPDWVRVFNMEDSDVAELEWNRNMMRTATMTEGRLNYTAGGLVGDARTVAEGGIRQFLGGNLLAAASTVYLIEDFKDYRKSDTYGTIVKWTLGSSANRTGNFDVGADTDVIGIGSQISIMEDIGRVRRNVAIVAMTSNGELANEVTLSESVKTGQVQAMGRLYDYIGGSVGQTMKEGFSIHATSIINVSGEMIGFEAGSWE